MPATPTSSERRSMDAVESEREQNRRPLDGACPQPIRAMAGARDIQFGVAPALSTRQAVRLLAAFRRPARSSPVIDKVASSSDA